MGRCGARHLLLFSLLALSSLAFATASSSFSECYPDWQLQRFWDSGRFTSGNPNIESFWWGNFYETEFDSSEQGLGIPPLSLSDKRMLESSVDAGLWPSLAGVEKAQVAAQQALQSAKNASASAHLLSLAAQSSLAKYDFWKITGLVSEYALSGFNAMSVAAGVLPDVETVYDYAQAYPSAYSESLGAASALYSAAEAEARAIAGKADSEYSFLQQAGAGSESYSGAAKGAYFSAQEYLSESGRCSQDLASSIAISDYFDSAPQMPDFDSIGFSGHLRKIAGAHEGSSVILMAKAYSALSAARIAMEKEYSVALGSAKASQSRLSSELESLRGEELGLIGDAPASAGSGTVLVGPSYSGIYSGYLKISEDSEASKDYLDAAAHAYSGRGENYLADAISNANAASEISQNAISSAALVRASAESAVLSQGREAEDKIAGAEAKAGGGELAFADVAAQELASSLLSRAKAEFLAASSQQTLGKKFQSYSRAISLASQSTAASEGGGANSLKQEVGANLRSHEKFLQLAASDHLDVEYEKARLADYQQSVQNVPSLEMLLAVQKSMEADRQAVLLRLSEKYSGLAGKHAELKGAIGEIRKQDPSFLAREFKAASAYFPDGALSVENAAGHLAEISGKLDGFAAEVQGRTPAYLSYLLSKNAMVSVLAGIPVLGQETEYEASIYTDNPSSLSYSAPLTFSVASGVPIYSSDFSGGDDIADAYPDKGKLVLTLPSVQAGSRLSFIFKKQDAPAQITSSHLQCPMATASEAQAKQTVEFFTSRTLPELTVSVGAPPDVSDSFATYSGKRYSLQPLPAADGASALEGAIWGVKQGKNNVEVSYTATQPFSVSQGERAHSSQAGGAKQVSFEVTIEGADIGCDSALITMEEPFRGISSFAVSSLGEEKASQAKATETGGATQLSFLLSPLKKGGSAAFAVSYVISDPESALSDALAAAELQVGSYNRTKDLLSLQQAKALALQNRTDEALSILSKMKADAAQLSHSYADYQEFKQEKSEAESSISDAESAQSQLSDGNSMQEASELSTIIAKFRSSVSSASDEAEAKSYSAGLQSIRKAAAEFRSSLASLAWKQASGAQDSYAKARKGSPGAASDAFQTVQAQIELSQKQYSKGEHLQSLVSSAVAMKGIEALAESSLLQSEADAAAADAIRKDFSSLRSKTDALLARYSQQYSALSGASKKQVPITPSEVQQRLEDAQKALSAASKSSLSASQSLAAANDSYQKLEQVYGSIGSAMSSLQSSAESSLEVAKLALEEVKSKAEEPDAESAAQIESEVSRAEGFLSASLYSDSIVSSDRAIKAANAFLAGKGTGGIDAKAILLAAVSLAFLGIAAYYFIAKSKPGNKKEKRSLPKEE